MMLPHRNILFIVNCVRHGIEQSSKPYHTIHPGNRLMQKICVCWCSADSGWTKFPMDKTSFQKHNFRRSERRIPRPNEIIR